MTNKVETEFTADDREIIRSMLRQQKELTNIQRKLLGVGRAGKGAGKATSGSFKQASSEVGGLARSMIGLGATIQGVRALITVIKQEAQEASQRRERARIAQSTAGAAIREARVAFSEDKTVKDADLETRITEIAERTRTPVPIVAAAATNAFSAKGSLSNKLALEAVEQSFRLLPGNLESGTTLSGRALDVAKISGNEDIKSIIGFLQNVQQSSRVTSLDKVGATAVPAIGALVSRGDTPEQAAELYAAITQLTADEEGRKSSTGLINFSKQLGEFVPNKKGKDDRGKFEVPADQITAYEKANSTTTRVGVLQNSPELRREFLSKASFEAFTDSAFRGLLAGSDRSSAELGKAQKSIQAIGPGQAKIFENKIDQLEAGRFQGALSLEQQSAVNIESSQLESGKAGRTAAVEKIFDETFAELNFENVDFLKRHAIKRAFHDSVLRGEVEPELAGSRILGRLSRDPGQHAFGESGPTQKEVVLLEKQTELLEKMLQQQIVNGARQAKDQGRKPQVPKKRLAENLGRN